MRINIPLFLALVLLPLAADNRYARAAQRCGLNATLTRHDFCLILNRTSKDFPVSVVRGELELPRWEK